MRLRSLLMAGTVVGLASGLAGQVSAQSTNEQIRAQQAQIDYMKRQIDLMQQKLQDLQNTTQATQQAATETAAQVAKVTPPKGKKGLQMGAVTITPGGFIEAADVYRNKNMFSDIDTKFSSVPFGNSSNDHVDEFRFSARQSRIALLATADIDPTTHVAGYYEMDFLGAAGTANSSQSNSYQPRIRHLYTTLDWDDWGFHLLAGQTWSLVTLNSKGITPRNEVLPLTIDPQYVVGFDWTRQPQVRITQDLMNKQLWLALSIENPQTTITGTAPTGAGTDVTNAGGNLFDASTAYSVDAAPDVIAKVAFEPGFGHYEAYGIMSFQRDRVNFINHTTLDGGGGASAALPIVPTYLDLQLTGQVGQGIGRYATGQLPDVTFSDKGIIHPLTNYSALIGLIGHPDPSLDIYGYTGIEHDDRWYQNLGAAHYGYGNPAFSNAGCTGNAHIEGNTALACTANIRDLMEVTAGFWWKMYQGDFGSVRVGAQYEYIAKNVWPGAGGGGTADNNIVETSFRYYPF